MQNRSGGQPGHWSPGVFVLKFMALAAPWGVIENTLADYHHPDVGYTIGMIVGICCMQAIRPRDVALWRFAPVVAIAVLLRLTLGS